MIIIVKERGFSFQTHRENNVKSAGHALLAPVGRTANGRVRANHQTLLCASQNRLESKSTHLYAHPASDKR